MCVWVVGGSDGWIKRGMGKGMDGLVIGLCG